MRTTVALLCLLLPLMGLAWPGQTDYLALLQKAAPKDRLAVARKIYNDQLIHLDSARALSALNRINKWATAIHDIPLKVFSVIAMGDYHKEYFPLPGDQALVFFTIALEMALENEVKESEAEIYNNMGWLYHKQNKFPLAFEYMIKANNIIRTTGYEIYPYSNRYLYDGESRFPAGLLLWVVSLKRQAHP